MRVDKFSKELKTFVKDAMSLNTDESVSYEVDGTHYNLAVTADNDGFNCELLYSPNGVDDIKECAFVNKDKVGEIPTVIEYFMNCI